MVIKLLQIGQSSHLIYTDVSFNIYSFSLHCRGRDTDEEFFILSIDSLQQPYLLDNRINHALIHRRCRTILSFKLVKIDDAYQTKLM
jgi:hypothetical protein